MATRTEEIRQSLENLRKQIQGTIQDLEKLNQQLGSRIDPGSFANLENSIKRVLTNLNADAPQLERNLENIRKRYADMLQAFTNSSPAIRAQNLIKERLRELGREADASSEKVIKLAQTLASGTDPGRVRLGGGVRLRTTSIFNQLQESLRTNPPQDPNELFRNLTRGLPGGQPEQSQAVNKSAQAVNDLNRALFSYIQNESKAKQVTDSLVNSIERQGVSVSQLNEFMERTLSISGRRVSGRFKLEGGGQITGRAQIPFQREDISALVGPQAFEEIERRATDAGFAFEHLTEVQRLNAEGLTRLKFGYRDSTGVLQRLTLFTDRYGNVLQDTQKRFRTFFSAITRNIAEVFKWTVAITLIYAPLRRLTDLVRTAIENETELANVAVVLGENTRDLGDIFDEAAAAAKATGETIDGVLEGYTLALRATGNITDEAERSATAQRLLVDSLILSKLSSLEQAEALDILAGALLQVNEPLDNGQLLLNKWVAVSKVANVSLETLAESFAITAANASSVELNIDELNAIIATLAEVTNTSAEEAGNAIRGIISGFKTDQAREELRRFGIATQNVNGEFRGFIDILTEVRSLSEQGLITEEQLGQIARAIGGRGARREAQVTAIVKNLERINEIAPVSAAATDEAYEALDIQLQTVQTSINELNNAFQSLAQTLGEEGGVLSIANLVLDTITSLVGGIDSLVESLGNVAPLAGVLGVAFSYLSGTGQLQAGVSGGALRIGTGLAGILGRTSALSGLNQRLLASTTAGAGLARPVTQEDLGLRIAGGIESRAGLIGGIIAQGIMGVLNVREGDWEGLGGQVAGGIAGFLITGSPLGATIGSLIGDSFASAVFGKEVEFEDFFNEVFRPDPEAGRGATPKGPGGFEETPEEELARLKEEFEILALSTSGLTEQQASFLSSLTQAAGYVSGIFGGRFKGLEPAQVAALLSQGPSEETALGFGGGFIGGFLGATGFAPELEENLRRQEELRRQAEAREAPFETTAGSERLNRILEEQGDRIQELSQILEEDYRRALNEGEISTREFADRLEGLATLDVRVGKVVSGLGESFESTGQAVETITEFIGRSSEENIQFVINYVTEIERLRNELAQLSREEDPELFAQTQARMQELTDTAFNLIQTTEQIRLADLFELPEVTEIEFDETELRLIIEEAGRLQQETVTDAVVQGILDPRVAEAWEQQLEPVTIQLEGGQQIQVPGIAPEFLQQAQQGLQATGAITPSRFPVEFLDISSGQQQQFIDAVRANEAFLRERFGEEFLDPETLGLVFSDNVTDILHADQLAIRLAIEELTEVTKEQGLSGIFNLPANASFFVPFTAAIIDAQTRGARGGGAGISSLGTQIETLGDDIENSNRQTEQSITESSESIANFLEKLDSQGIDLPAQDRLFLEDLSRQLDTGEDVTQPVRELAGSVEGLREFFGEGTPQLRTPTPGEEQDIVPDTTQRQVEPIVTIDFNLTTNSNIQLQLDGEIVAAVVKKHLFQDLIDTEGTTGSINRNIII